VGSGRIAPALSRIANPVTFRFANRPRQSAIRTALRRIAPTVPGMVTVDSATPNTALLRRTYAAFPSGVTAVCAVEDGVPVGMAASAFTPASLDPPLLSVGVQLTSRTWPRLRGRARLGLSVLAHGQADACRRLSQKTGDRFAGVRWWEGEGGAVVIDGAAAWFECSLHDELPAGDHLIALLRVHRLHSVPGIAPLVFHDSRFRQLLSHDGEAALNERTRT
jgi:flavin reductase (DIM6/NTAB) family NADH-FMN oxidoreductase RutF